MFNNMEIKIGDVVEGIITGIKPYGVFIKINEYSGFCHISNISNKFVKNINEWFTINQKITSKVLEINENNKLNVSIKACESNKDIIYNQSIEIPKNNSQNFEDMLKNFLKSSDEKLDDITKRNKKYQN